VVVILFILAGLVVWLYPAEKGKRLGTADRYFWIGELKKNGPVTLNRKESVRFASYCHCNVEYRLLHHILRPLSALAVGLSPAIPPHGSPWEMTKIEASQFIFRFSSCGRDFHVWKF